jgi:hypothetical protein
MNNNRVFFAGNLIAELEVNYPAKCTAVNPTLANTEFKRIYGRLGIERKVKADKRQELNSLRHHSKLAVSRKELHAYSVYPA